ncbi:arabinosyltransferase B [Klenkia brasiliensis]|uniref:Arabinosyltransferase B n=1 Tax=Klenkia brasiliensis TaxID=333142 RepID=A0A1G7RFI1_9ACTN|nr:arabinosyltransferase B [Klenkia brasiliensis]
MALLGVAVVALLASVLLPVAPVQMSTPSVSWPVDQSQPTSTMLQLTSQRPVGMQVDFSCATARAAGATTDGVVLSTIRPDSGAAAAQGLVVAVREGELLVDVAGDRLLDQPLGQADCTWTVQVDATGTSVLRDGRAVDGAATPTLPDVDVLATSLTRLVPDDGETLAVRIDVDDQFATSPSPVKLALVVVALLAAAAALVLLPGAARGRRPAAAARGGRLRALARPSALVHAAVGLAVVGWAFLTPMTGDDGYYAAMARNAPIEGYVGNYYQLYNQNFTPFTWFYRGLGSWESVAGSSPLALRVPALLAGLATYALAVAVVRAASRSVWSRVALALVFLAWWLPQDMGVRPESMVALAAVGALAGVCRAVARQSLRWVAVSFGVAAVGFVCHPTGFVALAPVVAALPALARLVRSGTRTATTARLAGVLAAGAPAAVLAFGDGTLRDFLRGQEIFLSIQAQEDWTSEYLRYQMLLAPGFMGAYAKRLPVLLALVGLVVWLVLRARSRGAGRSSPRLLDTAGTALALSFLLLWLTPSKWTFHFGSLAGVGSVFLTLLLVRAVQEARGPAAPPGAGPADARAPLAPRLAVAGVVVLAVALSFTGPNSWPSSWMLGVPHADVPPYVSVVRLGSPLVWVVVAAVAAVLLRRRRGADRPRRGGWAGAVTGATVVVVVAALVTSNGYLLGSFGYAAVRPQASWTPWGDTVRDPSASGCHAAGAFRTLDDRSARPLTVQDPTGAGGDFVDDGGFLASSPPPPAAVGGVRGSLQPDGGEEFQGVDTSGWYGLDGQLEDGTALAVAVSGRTGGDDPVVAEFGRRDGASVDVVSSVDVSDGVDAPYWRVLPIPVDAGLAAGADLVRLVVTDGSVGVGGWVAHAAPAVFEETSLQAYLGDRDPSGVAWQIALLFPCQALPEIRSGITQPSSTAVLYGNGLLAGLADATWLDVRGGIFAPSAREATVTALPTWLPGAPQVTDVTVVSLDNPYPVDGYRLTTGTTTVSGWAPPPGWGGRAPV